MRTSDAVRVSCDCSGIDNVSPHVSDRNTSVDRTVFSYGTVSTVRETKRTLEKLDGVEVLVN
jgi:hypothetical protein